MHESVSVQPPLRPYFWRDIAQTSPFAWVQRHSDSQAHAVLSIVRELTANAICHGKAANVRIAGCLDGGRIVFSVRDDGTGFDPALCGGPTQGHFGLSGIRTRVKKLGGTLEIDSCQGKGTNVKVSILI